MRDLLRVLDLNILIDAMLFPMSDGFKIRLKLHIQYGIAANTNWLGLASNVVWMVALVAKATTVNNQGLIQII